MRLQQATQCIHRSANLHFARPHAWVALAAISLMHGSAQAESVVPMGLVVDESDSSSPVVNPAPPPLNLGSSNIVLHPDASLSGNAPALAAFNRAAAQWEAFISDPITVDIDAGLAVLSASTIGQASSMVLTGGYTTVRNAMVTDGANEFDDAITQSLPTAAQFTATVPGASTLSGNVALSRANAKALGFTGLPGSTDGTITFNSTFGFDYDNSDGVGAGLVDFETVAAHEIGHTLGFFSAVDDVDAGDTSISPTPLDFYRFANSASATSANFATAIRSLTTGGTPLFDDGVSEWLFSTGAAQGDGRQASHWKDNSLTGNLIGMLNPTLGTGEIFTLTVADLRAIDLIGYEIVVPEPASFTLVAFAALMLVRRRR